MPVSNIDITTTNNAFVAAPGSGFRWVVVGWRFTASAATFTKVQIRDGAAGSILSTTYAANIAGGGENVPDGSVALRLSENTAIALVLTGTGSLGGTITYRKERVFS